MKLEFLKKSGTSKLILIFAGWGSDHILYEGIEITGWDTAVAYDFYSNSDDNFTELINSYHTIYLYAWSLGVEAASTFLSAQNITAAFALNGTELPCHDSFGIPEDIYYGTLNNLSERTLKKFRRRMVESSSEFSDLETKLPSQPDIISLQSQLLKAASDKEIERKIKWNRAYVSRNDKIFPPDSQIRFWNTYHPETGIIEINAPHYYNLETIVRSTIPDLMTVADNFRTSLPIYEDNATAQNIISERLTALLSEIPDLKKNCEIMEIGPGSGLFTRKYSEILTPAKATFIELYSPVRFNISTFETYITGDAEEEIKRFQNCFDYILSSSVVQWFSDLTSFIHNSTTALKDGGYFICSTFLPGTLCELETVRPDPMLYPDINFIADILKHYFSEVKLLSDKIILPFESARHALLHIRNTGAFGSFPSTAGLKELLAALNKKDGSTLTYIPLYIIAKK